MGKLYTLKIYDKAGTTFKGVLNQITSYNFQEVINGGLGEMSIEIPAAFNDTITPTQLDKIELWVQDRDTTGTLIYSGYIYKIVKTLSATDQLVRLSVIGYASRFGFTPDMADSTTLGATRNSLTITNMVKAIIDNFKTTIGDSIVNYSATSVETSATTLSYTSNGKTTLAVLERIRTMAGANWFWRVAADGTIYFKQYAATPTHVLILGKDINEIEITENSDTIENFYSLYNGLQTTDPAYLNKVYYNTASVAAYWKRLGQATDGRIKDATYLDLLGTAYINAAKGVNKMLTFTVKDNNYGLGYDIETIHVGDTVRILNVKDSELYSGNLVVTGLDYSPEQLRVTVADSRALTSRSLTDLRNSLDQTVYDDAPSTFTLVSV